MEDQARQTPQPVRGLATGRDGKVNLFSLTEAKRNKTRWAMVSCYDYTTACLFDSAGVPVLLVGDSAALVMLGYESTLRISVEEMLVFTAGVSRGASRALVVADLPFGSYEQGPTQALGTAARFLKETGARAVKVEGGARIVPQVQAMVQAGIPVFAHIGLAAHLAPLHFGYRDIPKPRQEKIILDHASALASAGASAIVCEQVPESVIAQLARNLEVPVVSVGPSASADAELAVSVDLLGVPVPGRTPKMETSYANIGDEIRSAAGKWLDVVENKP